MKVTCPHCGKKHQVNAAALLGSTTSNAKAEAARANGAKGGRPRKKDANEIAHGIVAEAIKRTER